MSFKRNNSIQQSIVSSTVNLKYYLHKHILSTHEIDVELDEIKMKRDRKNKSWKPDIKSTTQVVEAMKKKERQETRNAYQASQKAKQQVNFSPKLSLTVTVL